MKDISGQKFNLLTAIKPVYQNNKKHWVWLFKCDCGNEKEIVGYAVTRGGTHSCGCYLKSGVAHIKHGESNSPSYISWRGMLSRCLDKNHNSYNDYGGKGITICDRWLKSFSNFIEDLGKRPPRTTLDRINNDLGYFKKNCRWATYAQQARNRSSTKLTEDAAKYIRLSNLKNKELASMFSVSVATIEYVRSGFIWNNIND